MGWFPCCCGGDNPCATCGHYPYFPTEAILTAPGEFFVHVVGWQCFNLGTIEYVLTADTTECVSTIFHVIYEEVFGTDGYTQCELWCLSIAHATFLSCGEVGWFLRLQTDPLTGLCRFKAVFFATRLDPFGRGTVIGWAVHIYATDWFTGPYDVSLTYTLRWRTSVVGGIHYTDARGYDIELSFA